MTETQMMVLELAANNYSCAQIILIGGLRLMGRENPDLVRAAAGLAQGIGNTGNICGALAGGLCLLAMHTAKGLDPELPHDQALVLQEDLVARFREQCCGGGNITCDAILGFDNEGGQRSIETTLCGGLVGWVWEECLAILAEYGIDPTEGRPLE